MANLIQTFISGLKWVTMINGKIVAGGSDKLQAQSCISVWKSRNEDVPRVTEKFTKKQKT